MRNKISWMPLTYFLLCAAGAAIPAFQHAGASIVPGVAALLQPAPGYEAGTAAIVGSPPPVANQTQPAEPPPPPPSSEQPGNEGGTTGAYGGPQQTPSEQKGQTPQTPEEERRGNEGGTQGARKEQPGHEGGTPGARRARLEGAVARINKDKSTLILRQRNSGVERKVQYDSSTVWTSQERGSKKVNDIDASQVNDNDRVIVVGTYDKNGVLHATLISKRLTK